MYNSPHTSFRTVLVGVAGLVTHAAQAQLVNQDLKVIPADGGVAHEFGCDLGIDQGLMVIGARGDTTQGIDSGSAYVYNANSGALVVKLLPADGAAGDLFGTSVAIDNGIVAVGAPNDTHDGTSSGSVYLFDAVTGMQLSKLVPSDARDADMFGTSVAIDSGVVVVGAMGDDDQGSMSGSAYLFDAGTGAQIDKLLPDVGAANQAFGVSVAINAGIVGVGSRSYFVPSEGFTLSGVYLFDASSGTQQRVLRASNGVWTDFFGEDIDIDQGTVVVGAWARSVFLDHSGAAYVFDAASGDELHYIFPGDGHDRDNFGISVAIDDGIIAIGAHQDGDNGFDAGSAYLYDADTGSLINKVLASDGAQFDYFGTAVAIDSGVIAIGAIGDEDNGSDSGSVYLIGSSGGSCPADLTGDGSLDFFDVSAFLSAFTSQDPLADFTGDGQFNFFDVSAFLNAFTAGCP